MIDPCDNCNKPCCYNCEHTENEPCEKHMTKARKNYLVNEIHQASQIVWWLSYQVEMSKSEQCELEKMSAFLENLKNKVEDIE